MGPDMGKGDMPGCVLIMGTNTITNSGRVKFLVYMRLQKLKDTILPPDGAEIDNDRNAEAFAELIQFLDEKSLSLIMRDASDDEK